MMSGVFVEYLLYLESYIVVNIAPVVLFSSPGVYNSVKIYTKARVVGERVNFSANVLEKKTVCG